MKKHLWKPLSLVLLVAVLPILSIACETASIPSATPAPTSIPTVTLVPAPIPTATPVPTSILTAASVSIPIPTTTPVPALDPTSTYTPTPTPVPALISTVTSFNPDLVGLGAIGSSATVTVQAVGVDSGAEGVQINVQHPAELQVSSPVCAGIFAGGIVIGPASVTGGTATGCVLLTGDVSGPTGAAMTFDLTRIGDFNTDQVITFGVGGAFGTSYFDSGITIDTRISNQLIVRP